VFALALVLHGTFDHVFESFWVFGHAELERLECSHAIGTFLFFVALRKAGESPLEMLSARSLFEFIHAWTCQSVAHPFVHVLVAHSYGVSLVLDRCHSHPSLRSILVFVSSHPRPSETMALLCRAPLRPMHLLLLDLPSCFVQHKKPSPMQHDAKATSVGIGGSRSEWTLLENLGDEWHGQPCV